MILDRNGDEIEPGEITLCAVENYIAVDQLVLHPDNPRQISKDRLYELKLSICEKGFYQPILVWKKGNIILAGNHRYLAVKELIAEGFTFKHGPKGKDVLPVVIEDMSDEMAEAILYESNNHYAEWIEERLTAALTQAKEEGRDITAFGFDKDYVDVLLKSALSDAEGILDPTRKIEPPDYDDIEGAVGDHDEFESLILPRPVYESTVELLCKIAKGLNKEWKEGDSYSEAIQALCQFAREKGVEELWLKKTSSPKVLRRSSKEKPTPSLKESPKASKPRMKTH